MVHANHFISRAPVFRFHCYFTRWIAITVGMLFCLQGHANRLQFEPVMTEGYPNVAETMDITQDSDGFIWIGGSNGLARYDGKSFTLFQYDADNESSLSNNYVWDLMVDSRGQLWVATNNGLNRFVPDTQQFVRYLHDPDNPASLANNDVHVVFEDSRGSLWVGTQTGLDQFDHATGEFAHYTHTEGNPDSLSHPRITAIHEDTVGQLWVGTRHGLNMYQPETGSFSRFDFQKGGLDFNDKVSIRDIKEDAHHNLWISTLDGLFRFNQRNGEAEVYRHDAADPHSLGADTLWRITVDSKNQVWIATDYGGLSRYRHTQNDFVNYRNSPYDTSSISSDHVRLMYEDSAGDYWVALFPYGVDFANSSADIFSVYRHSPQDLASLTHDAVISVFPRNDGHIWVGTEKGLNLLDAATGQVDRISADTGIPDVLARNAILAIARGAEGDYWFGTWSGGLIRQHVQSGQYTHYLPDPGQPASIRSAYVWALLADRDGSLWVGTESGGLDRLDPATGEFSHIPIYRPGRKDLPSDFVRALAQDREGYVWAGTVDGLYQLDPVTEKFRLFEHKPGDRQSLPHNSVNAVFEGAQGNLWVGTGNGLARLDRETGQFHSYTRQDGLSDNSVMDIQQDSDGNLWIGTLNGLSRFAPTTGVFTSFFRTHGLAGNQMYRPAMALDDDGHLWAGSTDGLTGFNPLDIEESVSEPSLRLTRFRIFNQEVAIGRKQLLSRHIGMTERLLLNHTHNMFGFEFALLDYRNRDSIQYRYRLEGFDRQWIYSGNGNSATYTNLDAGDYLFKVEATIGGGLWHGMQQPLPIHINPPPWKSWWAYGCYVLLIGAALYGFWLSHRHKIAFEKLKVERLRSLDKLKDEFLANTSHELRTPLNGIIGLAESLVINDSGRLPEKSVGYLKMIVNSSRRLSHLIDDILDFSRIKNNALEVNLVPLDLQDALRPVLALTEPLAASKGLHLLCDVPVGLPAVSADPNRLQQILYNLIGNAIKFTNSGHVRISASADNAEINVQVEDTGIGIAPEHHESIFALFTQVRSDSGREYGGTGLGLAVAANLVALQGGKLSVSSRPGAGSIFSFTLKLAGCEPMPIKPQPDASYPAWLSEDVLTLDDAEIVVTDSPNQGERQFHLLIVENDAINRQVLRCQLALHSYRLSEAESGQEAIECLQADHSIDLVLMDVMMPVMNGYETTRQIRQFRPIHELPIIFITAKYLPTDLVTGFVSGGNDFLIKPVSKNELLTRIKTHLQLLDVTRNLENIVDDRTVALKETQKTLEAIDNVVSLINRQNDMAELGKILLRESVALMDNSDCGAFWLIDESSGAFVLVDTYGQLATKNVFPAEISRSLVEAQQNANHLNKKGVLILDSAQLSFMPQPEGRTCSLLVMTIEVGEALTGLLVLLKAPGTGVFTEHDRELFARLEPHAVSAVAKAEMLEILKQQNQKLERTSYSDYLTGLNNRHALMRAIPGDVALCKRHYEVAAGAGKLPRDSDLLFLMLDIDFFKQVNDLHGHLAGDAVLQQFAAILRSVFRESDHIVRWGGEEFLVVVRFFDRSRAAGLAERFRREVELAEFDIGDQLIRKTCSVGFSCYPFYTAHPQTFNWEQVVELADKCLYAAKKTGRNAWVGVYGDETAQPELTFDQIVNAMPTLHDQAGIVVQTSLPDQAAIDWQ